MKLNYQTYFDHAQPSDHGVSSLVIIPGLFGSVGNWRSFARKLSQHFPVVVVDQRNHGQSPHSPNNSYFDLAADVIELLDDLDIETAIICGHSMGGKTAMVLALTQPQRVSKLIVLDIAPVSYSHSHAPILQALKNVDLSQAVSRLDVEQQLMEGIKDKSTRLFIMLSLVKEAESYRWRLNIDSLYDNLHLIGGFPNDELANKNYHGSCLFVKGGDSDYIQLAHHERIKNSFPLANITTIDKAGHWLHIDQQDAVLEQIVSF